MGRQSPTDVYYRDRLTRAMVAEKNLDENALRWFYESPLGFNLFQALLNNALFCRLYGYYQKLPFTRRKIEPFVTQHRIDTQEIELSLDKYPNFNSFFSRRLKPDARPFTKDTTAFCSPADGKVLIYSQLTPGTCMDIKGVGMPLESLLASNDFARVYHNGFALVVRLAPYDYHRFHFPDTGIAHPPGHIPGQYHSVNPIALAQIPNVFSFNKRAVTHFDSQNFGSIAYIEVGAFTVGSIVQTYTPGPVNRGQEKGYFQYGGSTLVLLFEPGSILFDQDLMQDSAEGIEVQVRAGTQIGRSGIANC